MKYFKCFSGEEKKSVDRIVFKHYLSKSVPSRDHQWFKNGKTGTINYKYIL